MSIVTVNMNSEEEKIGYDDICDPLEEEMRMMSPVNQGKG
jgi:hypothetical protein